MNKSELAQLKNLLLEMSTLAEEQVRASVEALRERDAEKADSVIVRDREVDALEIEKKAEPIRIGGDSGVPITIGEPKSVAAQAFRSAAERLAAHPAVRDPDLDRAPAPLPQCPLDERHVVELEWNEDLVRDLRADLLELGAVLLVAEVLHPVSEDRPPLDERVVELGVLPEC